MVPTLGFDTKQRNSFLVKFGVFLQLNKILTILFIVKYENITHFDEFLVLLGPIISRLFTCSNEEKKWTKTTKGACSSPISMYICMRLYLLFMAEKWSDLKFVKWYDLLLGTLSRSPSFERVILTLDWTIVLTFIRDSLLKGKAQYGWSPCTNEFRSAHFGIENIIYLCCKTNYTLMRKSSVLNLLSPSVSVPCIHTCILQRPLLALDKITRYTYFNFLTQCNKLAYRDL